MGDLVKGLTEVEVYSINFFPIVQCLTNILHKFQKLSCTRSSPYKTMLNFGKKMLTDMCVTMASRIILSISFPGTDVKLIGR